MENACLAESHPVAYEVQVNLDVFGALMLDGVTSEIRRTDVITVDDYGASKRMLELEEKLMQPT